ncbi:MAG: response regulator transcription factor [Actinomycetota bacterium]|nr:response regulator transcription factor [Actinomycetota bacterium]
MRLIVADDSLLFREGVVRLLGEQGFDVLAQAYNAEDLVRRVSGLRPDAALVDMRMPPSFTDEGLKAALEIGERHPAVGVLVLSQYIESGYAMQLLKHAGAGRGYLLKDRVGDLETFAEAIRRVGEGGSVIDPAVIAALVDRQRPAGPLDELTQRERQCLALMAEGRSNAGICERISISPRTVESHIRTIFHKLELGDADDDHRRVLAVLAYLRSS